MKYAMLTQEYKQCMFNIKKTQDPVLTTLLRK